MHCEVPVPCVCVSVGQTLIQTAEDRSSAPDLVHLPTIAADRLHRCTCQTQNSSRLELDLDLISDPVSGFGN